MKESNQKSNPYFNPSTKPLLIVLSGPSGVGKDAVLSRMKKSDYPLRYITTMTTRLRRPRETDGVDYLFVSNDKFQEMIKNNNFLEWANVYGNLYGVPRSEVVKALDEGKDTMVKVDVQGAASIKKVVPQAVFIFLMPPSIEELTIRLEKRSTESPDDLALRVEKAEEEIAQLPLFDYVVFNRLDKIEQAVTDIEAIISAEKFRVNQRDIAI